MFGKGDKKKRPFWHPVQGDIAPEYTLAEKREMQFEYRHWHCKPARDLRSPWEVHDWAMALQRPGESRGDLAQFDADHGQQRGECNYIARCVAVAQATEERRAWRAFKSQEERDRAQSIAESMRRTADNLAALVAEYDAMDAADVATE